MIKICYFGIFDPEFSRNKIYIAGLKAAGAQVELVRDDSPGIRKWWNLARKLSDLDGDFDAIVAGYPGHITVPIAKLFSRGKPVIADLLGALSDAERHSHMPTHWKLFKAKAADALSVRFADIVLLESEAQRRYFERLFDHAAKYEVLYTGSWLAPQPYRPDPNKFTALFRGSLTPESGIFHILDAARMLKDDNRIKFRIVGRGKLQAETADKIRELGLKNVEFVQGYLSEREFARQYDGASLALGQFEDNPRLSRTIPHKAFEAFSAGVPYLTGGGEGVKEIVKDGETGFIVPLADAKALADKISELSKQVELLKVVSKKAQTLYTERFAP